ncbi:MAG: type II toxin-antitoxin system VapC family toxin [Vicinamibacterales bacterium]
MAGRDVFIDTSGLYGLIDKRDAQHAAARSAAEAVARSGRKLIVTDYIVSETVTLAKARGSVAVALRALDLIERSVGVRVEWIDVGRFEATKAFFRKHADHTYSFADCSSFVVMRELQLRQALTTDRHFVEAGFDALLSVRRA